MERTEPTLVPEWLKGTGSSTGSASSSSHSDDRGVTLPVRNRSSVSIGGYDNGPRSSVSDRISSSYFRRSSSSNSSMVHDRDSSYSRSYSSFGRNHRDRDRDRTNNNLEFRGKERSVLEDHRNYFDTDILSSRIEKEMLRRSQSMKSGKLGEVWPRRSVTDSNSVNSNHNNNNGAGLRNITIIRKNAFDKDFPSLGAEEKDMSSGVSTAVQGLPMGSSPMIGGNGWTSALVEAPVTVGSNSTGHQSSQQTAPPIFSSSTPSTSYGRNMAETLAQIPAQARTIPQAFAETQRLKDLEIKKSRQLIPMTPSTPKNSVLNSEKQKLKAASRSDVSSLANKAVQQQLPSSLPLNLSQRVGQPAHGGKILVLKPVRENGISPATKDTLNLPVAGKIAKDPVSTNKSPLNSQVAVATQTSSMEKKPTTSQAQSRSDFFNLMRKKTSTNISSAATEKKSCEMVSNEVVPAPVNPQCCNAPTSSPHCSDSPPSTHCSDAPPSSSDWSVEDVRDIATNGNSGEAKFQKLNKNEENLSVTSDYILYPYEEEVTFLRSLGWDENSGEGGLTEEEINAFYKEVANPNLSA
ncbi:hypothetical protein GIB67_004516 [Kingdonia uniflora]|uniref:Uncharacterized protein n=1 Tax=Kingdonia uniflora TaxID=39325 RepID=A0A7J7LS92_9MAGN|nr:hypothetical protein GIB67_004516 [Kingdonia uniflora]